MHEPINQVHCLLAKAGEDAVYSYNKSLPPAPANCQFSSSPLTKSQVPWEKQGVARQLQASAGDASWEYQHHRTMAPKAESHIMKPPI